MIINNPKKNVLRKIKTALAKPVPMPFSETVEQNIFSQPQQTLEIEFAENFSKLEGRFSFCSNEQELVEQLNTLIAARKWTNIFCSEKILINRLGKLSLELQSNNLSNCHAAITSCEALIARTGSLMLSSAFSNGRTSSVYAPVHICIARMSQLVFDISDAFNLVKKKYGNHIPSLITLATGPSRTADIEKTLVVGVHGPKEVFCFLVDDNAMS
jgi:L-lactate dehydrogenase complex protein LldG